MLKHLVPKTLKARLRHRLRAMTRQVPYFPSFDGQNDYCIAGKECERREDNPVPPPAFWWGYGDSAAAYLESGRTHVANMVRLLARSGFDVGRARCILDFGCGAGRMIRHLPPVAEQAALWGVDIEADLIRWCRHHLAPRIRFAVTTTIPHLPFPDGHFDLIYCGSVFTHIEDLEDAWLLELARVLAPGGRLYLTIHDEHTIRQFEAEPTHALARQLLDNPVYQQHRSTYRMIVIGRAERSQVFYDAAYFRSLVPPQFRWLLHEPCGYGYQSVVVLERLPN
jgi:SAM-dependent methyltransferase